MSPAVKKSPFKEVDEIRQKLFSHADEKYRNFQSALVPTVEKERIIGVRTPALRAFSKELSIGNSAQKEVFLSDLPHYYYDENNLHAFLVEKEKDCAVLIGRLREFLPFVDNWATCDSLSPAAFKKCPKTAEEFALDCLDSDKIYTVRLGIVTLLKLFTGERFRAEQAEKIATIKTDEYYVYSAIAWYFATLLTKRYEDALPFLLENKLDSIARNLTIKKATESLVVSAERKAFLKGLKIK